MAFSSTTNFVFVVALKIAVFSISFSSIFKILSISHNYHMYEKQTNLPYKQYHVKRYHLFLKCRKI